MFDFIYAGGPAFMWPLGLLFLAIVALTVLEFVRPASKRTALIVHLGVFSVVFGVLGQSLGLMQALDAIEAMGNVSPAMLAGGLKVSFISTITGLVNLAVAVAAWTILRYRAA